MHVLLLDAVPLKVVEPNARKSNLTDGRVEEALAMLVKAQAEI